MHRRKLVIILGWFIYPLSLSSEPLFFGNEPKQPHPIDKKYEQCISNWDGENIQDWYACCYNAEREWDAKLNQYYKALMPLLDSQERKLLVRSQRAWLTHFESKKQMLTEFLEMEPLVGREGYITVLDNLVQMKRARALELHDFIEAKKLQISIPDGDLQ